MKSVKKDYFNGCEWEEVGVDTLETWFVDEIKWNRVKELMQEGDRIALIYDIGDTIYYKKQSNGKYAFPVKFGY